MSWFLLVVGGALAGLFFAKLQGLGQGRGWALALRSPSLMSELSPARLQLRLWGCALFGLLPTELSLKVYERLKQLLVESGTQETLTVEELPLLCLGLGAMAGLGLHLLAPSFPLLSLMGASAGVVFPWTRLSSLAMQRRQAAARDLPRWMELLALCLSAGMDFTGGLRELLSSESGLMKQELSRTLLELELGHSRAWALRSLMERLPAPEVRDFVQGIIQAEEKGAPLAIALRQLANSARQRRSVRAEELAARASVLLLVPLMLLLLCILLLLVGPLLVSGMGF